jgi:hypothetical protein
MEESRVDDGIEHPPERLEPERVRNQELHLEAFLQHLRAGPLDRGRHGIDADDGMAQPGQVQRVLTRAAAGV